MLLASVALAVLAVGGHRGYRMVRGWFGRTIGVCVLTDFSFRDQKPNWPYQINLWFAEVNRIFAPAGVQWRVKVGGESYPEQTEGRLIERRELIEQSAACQADVVLGLTSIPDRETNSSVVPFTHAALVAVTAPDSDAMAVQTLSRALARWFGASIPTQAMVIVDAPETEALDPTSLNLVSELRSYDFSRGISGLSGPWERKAVAAIRDSLASRRPNPEAEARRVLGRAYAAVRKHVESIAQFREAVRLAPRDSAARLELAMELRADTETEEAIAELRRIYELTPDDARPHAVAGAIFLNRNRPYDAIDELRTAVSLDAGNAGYQAALGRALSMQVGHGAEAAAAFEAALRLRPAEERAREGLEAAQGGQDLLLDLVSQTESKARQTPNSSDAQLRLGMALAASGQRAAAVKALERSLVLDPQNGVVHLALARVYYREGAYAKARQSLDAARAAGANTGKDFTDALQRKLAAK